MSAYNQPLFVWRVSSNTDEKSLACRIGFVGNPINRFDQELTGKILGQRRFERKSATGIDCETATESVKKVLTQPINDHCPASSQYLLVAELSGNEETLKEAQLQLAINWLKSKKVEAIVFQYSWMLKHLPLTNLQETLNKKFVPY